MLTHKHLDRPLQHVHKSSLAHVLGGRAYLLTYVLLICPAQCLSLTYSLAPRVHSHGPDIPPVHLTHLASTWSPSPALSHAHVPLMQVQPLLSRWPSCSQSQCTPRLCAPCSHTSFFFFWILAMLRSMQDGSPVRDGTQASAVKAQNPNPEAIRELPPLPFGFSDAPPGTHTLLLLALAHPSHITQSVRLALPSSPQPWAPRLSSSVRPGSCTPRLVPHPEPCPHVPGPLTLIPGSPCVSVVVHTHSLYEL